MTSASMVCVCWRVRWRRALQISFFVSKKFNKSKEFHRRRRRTTFFFSFNFQDVIFDIAWIIYCGSFNKFLSELTHLLPCCRCTERQLRGWWDEDECESGPSPSGCTFYCLIREFSELRRECKVQNKEGHLKCIEISPNFGAAVFYLSIRKRQKEALRNKGKSRAGCGIKKSRMTRCMKFSGRNKCLFIARW